MAIRKILTGKEDALHKNCRPVTDFNERLWTLLDDMAETMYQADGVGLAGPQVGILRRVVVIDAGEGLIELINPEIIKSSGEQEGVEGCLSFPGEYGIVRRPMKATVKAQDRHGEWFEMDGEGLLARAFCHELDHLSGTVFTERAIRMVRPEELEEA